MSEPLYSARLPRHPRARTLRGRLSAPAVPAHDPADPLDSAVIRGLTRSWGQRAAVKKDEPDLDALFDPAARDFPRSLMPFAEHPRFTALDERQQARLEAWAWIAYNNSVIDIEQRVVNPGFGVFVTDGFAAGMHDEVLVGVLQAMVDEQYHTLMHHNANAVTRRRRGWALPDAVLPPCRTVRAHDEAVGRAETPRDAALVRWAFTTVAETSISAYLGLLTGDEAVQPINRATVAVHRRDELVHSSLTGELLALVFDELTARERRVLVDALAGGVEAFVGSDTRVWAAILAHERIPHAEELLEVLAAGGAVVQDCTAIRRLGRRLGIAEDLEARYPFPPAG